MAEILGYSTNTDEKSTVVRVAKMHAMLNRHAEDVPEYQPLVYLLYQLLVWNPAKAMACIDKNASEVVSEYSSIVRQKKQAPLVASLDWSNKLKTPTVHSQ